jgi:hypothetical protein
MSEKNNELQTLIEKEIADYEKRTRLTWRVGLPLVLLVCGYLGYVGMKWNEIVLNPTNLAMFIADSIDADAPAAIRQTEQSLKQEAPAFVSWMHGEVIKMLDQVESQAELQVDTVFELLPVLDQSASVAIDEYFEKHKVEIKELYEAKNDQKYVEGIVDDVFTEFNTQLGEHFQVVFKGKDFTGIPEVSVAQLHHINERLSELAKMHPARMTPTERLERRVIVAWVNALGDQLDVRLYE